MSAPLPEPYTTEQEYLAAILRELRALNNKLGERPDTPAEQPSEIQIEEPKRRRRKE